MKTSLLARLLGSTALALLVPGCAYLASTGDGLPATKPYAVSAARRARVNANVAAYFHKNAQATAPVRLPAPPDLAEELRRLHLMTVVKGEQYWTNAALKASEDCTVYQAGTVRVDCRRFPIGTRVVKPDDFITARILHLDTAVAVFVRYHVVPATPLGAWGAAHKYWSSVDAWAPACPAIWTPGVALIATDTWSIVPQFHYDNVLASQGLQVGTDPLPPGPPESQCMQKFDYIAATLPAR